MMYLKLGIVAAVFVGLAFSHGLAYKKGRDAVLAKLAADRIEILKDGRKIDEEVLAADDDELLCMLVECVPDKHN